MHVPQTPFSSQPSTLGKGFFVLEIVKTFIFFFMKFCMPLFLTRFFGIKQLDSIVMGFIIGGNNASTRRNLKIMTPLAYFFHIVETLRC